MAAKYSSGNNGAKKLGDVIDEKCGNQVVNSEAVTATSDGKICQQCWGCSSNLKTPQVGDVPTETIDCSWCGALTETGATTCERRNHRSLFARLFSIMNRLRWGMVLFVNGLIMSIIVPGFVIILPEVYRSPLMYQLAAAFTFLCSFQVCLNYVYCVFSNPGHVDDFHPPALVDAYGKTSRDSLRGFRFCSTCRAPKSPDAHHCRTCGICVVDADHHCPFINNCVGRANKRGFLAFLIWISISVTFSAATCAHHAIRNGSEILALATPLLEAIRSGSVGAIMNETIIMLADLRLDFITALYIIGASFCVAVGVVGLVIVTLGDEVSRRHGGVRWLTKSPAASAAMWTRALLDMLGPSALRTLFIPAAFVSEEATTSSTEKGTEKGTEKKPKEVSAEPWRGTRGVERDGQAVIKKAEVEETVVNKKNA